MPELPEVETIRRGITADLIDKRVVDVIVRQRQLRRPVAGDFRARLIGLRVAAIHRRAKYLIMDLGSQQVVIHLGMSGRLKLFKEHREPAKHDHIDWRFSDDTLLRFHDPRRFGLVLAFAKTATGPDLLAGLGPEPLSDDFSSEQMFRASRGRKLAVKNFLMDGRVVVGIGNIYASESLFRSGIRPGRTAGSLTRAEYLRLVESVKQVLTDAIDQGGTTLADSSFSGADGSFGYFQQTLAVYARDGLPCRRCNTLIVRSIIGQRSSFHCPRCQR